LLSFVLLSRGLLMSLVANVSRVYPTCEVWLDLPPYYAPSIGVGIFVLFLLSFTIAYARKEHERTKNYYGRVDAASRRAESSKEQPGVASQKAQQMLQGQEEGQQQLAMETSAVNPSDTEAEDDAAEDELQGRNPNKISVIHDQSPSQHSAGIKVMMKKRKSVAQKSVFGNSLPRSSTVSAFSTFAPRVLFDSTSRGLEIMDIVSKGIRLAQPSEEKLRETILDAVKTKLDEIRERRHIVFAIPERNGEPMVKGAESCVGMMRQTLVLSVGFDMPAMRIYCYELDVGESATSVLAPGHSGSGSGNLSNTAVDRVTHKDKKPAAAGSGSGKSAVAAAKSPAPKAQVGVAVNPMPGSGAGSGKSEKKKLNAKMMEAHTQMTQITVAARSPNMPSSTCPSCPTKKSAATPTPQKRSIARKTGKRNSNYSRLRTARTPGAKTPQQTLVTAIEESLYSVQKGEKKSRTKSSKTKSAVKSEKKVFPV
ncbi:hypothetical protein PMAYCL1PPCAC_12906, partial [Pristionchus mayeri]